MLVTGVTYRYPGVLAKTTTTLDVLAGGRTMFGPGAAWCDREHHAPHPYPPVRERFEGKHYRLAETICQPPPLRRPPILIRGDGKKTLRLVAQYADRLEQHVGSRRVAAQARRAAPPLRRGRPRLR